jgi:hypothetical protein
MTFNNGDDATGILDYVSNISIDEDTGNIIITHINSGDTLLEAKLRKLVSARVSDNGIVTLTDNRGDSYNLRNANNSADYQ